MEQVQQKQATSFETLKGTFGYTNVMQTPKIEKIVVGVGTGKKARTDRHYNDLVSDRLAKITGQKPASRVAKKSVAGFKIREGEIVGQMVTLRGARARAFFDKLVHIALPRTKDFRGVKRGAVDQMGNLTVGIKEHTVFPETADEDIRNVFGLAVTVVTSAKSKEEASAYLTHLGVPFQKEVTKKKK